MAVVLHSIGSGSEPPGVLGSIAIVELNSVGG